MKKAPSIFLRNEISPNDVEKMIDWMQNPVVTEYMNEDAFIADSLKRLVATVPAPLLTYRFNQYGKFLIICIERDEPIGFVRFKNSGGNVFEIVYAIGDDSLWGRGYGKHAIKSALSEAFLFMRAEKIVAKIDKRNMRSIRLIRSCGFDRVRSNDKFHFYDISSVAFIENQKQSH